MWCACPVSLCAGRRVRAGTRRSRGGGSPERDVGHRCARCSRVGRWCATLVSPGCVLFAPHWCLPPFCWRSGSACVGAALWLCALVCPLRACCAAALRPVGAWPRARLCVCVNALPASVNTQNAGTRSAWRGQSVSRARPSRGHGAYATLTGDVCIVPPHRAVGTALMLCVCVCCGATLRIGAHRPLRGHADFPRTRRRCTRDSTRPRGARTLPRRPLAPRLSRPSLPPLHRTSLLWSTLPCALAAAGPPR